MMLGRIRREGFTLIEVVVAITILAILAAFALPRFASLEVETRAAATQALAGGVRSGSALSHALWLAQGQPATVTLEGSRIVMANGYPDLDSIDNTLSDLSGFTYEPASGIFNKSGTNAGCTVTYSEASSPGTAPAVAVNVSGC